MQNKPNLLNTQMNVNSVKTRNYENVRPRSHRQNKPNQTQFQSQKKSATSGGNFYRMNIYCVTEGKFKII